MKNYFIMLLAILWNSTALTATAQDGAVGNEHGDTEELADYQPIFTDGKEWLTIHGIPAPYAEVDNTFDTHQILHIAVDGEEEIEGIMCKRLKVTEEPCEGQAFDLCPGCVKLPESPAYYYVYEKDREIYVYRNPGPYYETEEGPNGEITEVVKYGDPYFGLYVNLNATVGENAIGLGTITEEFVKNYGGLECRTLGYYANDWLNMERDTQYWIEGIGSTNVANCFEHFMDSSEAWPTVPNATYLVLCTQDGHPFYDIREELMEKGINIGSAGAGISDIVSDSNTDSPLYDLDGRKVLKPIQGEIYIINGKKIIY